LKIERVGKFYELLTTHTMRRTGITILLQLGMPEHLVRQISGHAPNSKEFYRYVKIAQNWQDDESQRVYKLIAEHMPTPKK
jgi:integrase